MVTVSGMTRKRELQQQAPVFAALGDETRLTLLARLCADAPCSIAQLAEGSTMTRQAITKHLRILEGAGLVQSETLGRERVFELIPRPLLEAKKYLGRIASQWDETLARLKNLVEQTSSQNLHDLS